MPLDQVPCDVILVIEAAYKLSDIASDAKLEKRRTGVLHTSPAMRCCGVAGQPPPATRLESALALPPAPS